MVTIAVTVAMLLQTLIIYKGISDDLLAASKAKHQLYNQLVAEKARPIIEAAKPDLAQALLQQMYKHQPEINLSAIYLPNNSLLAIYSPLGGIPIPAQLPTEAMSMQGEKLILFTPVQKGTKTIGYVFAQVDLSYLNDKKAYYAMVSGGIFAVMLALSLALAHYFQSIITRPINRMVEHIRDIYTSGSFDKRLLARSRDEIGKLINGFNRMLDAVQERENELSARSRQLQRLVEIRTEQLYQKAHFDSLTGLPNRYLLVDRLHQAISKSSRNKSILALLFLDLDRFKVINDNLGHQNGDLLLKEVAKRLSKLAREGDTVARLGGDEFVFLLENLNSPKDAARTAIRIIESFNTPFTLQEHILHISTSIGISIYPDDGLDHKTLLKNADISMYHAKDKGPGHYSFYNKKMNESSLERLAIETNLRTAIENEELYLLYQPQLNLKDGRFHNVEALLRWKNPGMGNVPPDVFVPIAEETGMVNQIDRWVISEACHQIRKWNDQSLRDIRVAVNISAGHLISQSLIEHIKNEILANGISPAQLEIEITEAVFVEHTERTIDMLREIKQLGVRIAIDDFGTGYSSLQYIQNFPADTIKLDGMFIRNLKDNSSSQGIVRSTIILAHSLGLEIVSEGVEDEFQFNFLKQHQCDLLQGYLLAKPVTPDEVFALCVESNPLREINVEV